MNSRWPLPLELEVDVGRAAGIGDRLHGAEVILAAGAGHEAAKALEVGVALGVAVGRVQVHAVAVDLPDFDQRVADGIAGRIEHTAGEVRHFADGGRDAVVDDQQVVVGVERQAIGVERAFGLCGGQLECFGEGAADVPERQGKSGSCNSGALDELTAGRN